MKVCCGMNLGTTFDLFAREPSIQLEDHSVYLADELSWWVEERLMEARREDGVDGEMGKRKR